MYTWQFSKAQYTADLHGWTRFAAMQNHYNLVYREEEREMIPFCIDQGTALVCWSPLARGFLAGNRTREKGGDTDRSISDTWAHGAYYLDSDFDVLDNVRKIATQHNVTQAQISLAWVLNKSYVCAPIIGATKPNHLEEAVAALEIKLSPEEMTLLEDSYRPHPVAM